MSGAELEEEQEEGVAPGRERARRRAEAAAERSASEAGAGGEGEAVIEEGAGGSKRLDAVRAAICAKKVRASLFLRGDSAMEWGGD